MLAGVNCPQTGERAQAALPNTITQAQAYYFAGQAGPCSALLSALKKKKSACEILLAQLDLILCCLYVVG